MARIAYLSFVLLALGAAGELPAYEVGDEVVTIRDVPLNVDQQQLATVRRGMILTVEGVDGLYLLVTRGAKGWIEAEAVVPRAEAIGHFSAEIERDSDDVVARMARANLLLARAGYDAAIEDLDRVIQLHPQAERAYHQRGLARSKRREYDRALADLNEAIRLRDDYGIAYYNRGHVHYYLGQYDAAIADFDRAIQLLPNDASSFNNRGLAWYAKQEFDRAISDFESASRLSPEVALIYNNRGWAWYCKGQFDKAQEDFDRANYLAGIVTPGAPRAAGGKPLPPAPWPILSDARKAERLADREKFKAIWREIAAAGDTLGESPGGAMAPRPDGAEAATQGYHIDDLQEYLATLAANAPDETLAPATGATEMKGTDAPRSPKTLVPVDPKVVSRLLAEPLIGIYELEGDRLRIRGFSRGGPTPKQFATAPGDGSILLELRRDVSHSAAAKFRSDHASMQGFWRFATIERDGQTLPGARSDRVLFEGDTVTVRAAKGLSYQFRFALDRRLSPKVIELQLIAAGKQINLEKIDLLKGLALTRGYISEHEFDLLSPRDPVEAPQPVNWRSLLLALCIVVVLIVIAHYCGNHIAHGGQGQSGPIVARLRSPPTRAHFLVVAFVVTLLTARGTIASFDYSPIGVLAALDYFRHVSFFTTNFGNLASWIRDLVLAVPLSFVWMAVVAVDARQRRRRVVLGVQVVVAAVALRILVEFFDLWLNRNSSAHLDILPETAGLILGVCLWSWVGQSITDWIRSITIDRRLASRQDWILLVYCVGLVLMLVWPLDLTFRGADLARRYRDGMIVLVPFTESRLIARSIINLILFVPVGMFLATHSTSAVRPIRSKESLLASGLIVVVLLALVQLLSVGVYMTTTDIFSRLLGIAAGAMIMVRQGRVAVWMGKRRQRPGWGEYLSRVAPYLLVAVVYAMIVVVASCTPFEPIHDADQLSARYMRVFQDPLAVLRSGMSVDMLADQVVRAACFAPLGVFCAIAFVGPTIPAPVRGVLLAVSLAFVASVAMVIEVVQVYLPPNVPTFFDVIVATLGAVAGMVGTTAYVYLRMRFTATKQEPA